MGEPRDLQYIGSVLEGAPGTSGGRVTTPPGRKRSRDARHQHGRRGRAGGRHGSTGADAAAARSSHSRLQSEQPGAAAPSSRHQDGASSAAAGSSSGRDGSSSGAAPSQAAEASSRCGGRRCELCNCWVAGGDAGWRTHIAGIGHRRQELSVREFGSPGHIVVSLFESDVSTEAQQQRRLRQLSVTAQEVKQTEWERQPAEVRGAVQALRREVLNYCSSEDYQRVMLKADLEQSIRPWTGATYREAIRDCIVSLFLGPTLLTLPAYPRLEGVIIRGPYFLDKLEVPVLAASAALLGNTLPLLPNLTDVVFHWKLPAHGNTSDLRHQAIIDRGFSLFVHNAAAVLASSGPWPLRRVTFQLMHGELTAPPERLTAARDAFEATLAAAAAARRQALLMSVHPKSVAAGCLVGHLPTALLSMIMADGLPLQPCTCTITIVRPGEFTRPWVDILDRGCTAGG